MFKSALCAIRLDLFTMEFSRIFCSVSRHPYISVHCEEVNYYYYYDAEYFMQSCYYRKLVLWLRCLYFILTVFS